MQDLRVLESSETGALEAHVITPAAGAHFARFSRRGTQAEARQSCLRQQQRN